MKVFIGKVGTCFLYQTTNRVNEAVISIQTKDGKELMQARDEKSAREWCEAYSE